MANTYNRTPRLTCHCGTFKADALHTGSPPNMETGWRARNVSLPRTGFLTGRFTHGGRIFPLNVYSPQVTDITYDLVSAETLHEGESKVEFEICETGDNAGHAVVIFLQQSTDADVVDKILSA